MGLPCPFCVLYIFGGQSKSEASRAFKFGAKWVPIEVNNWWKFGVDISNHFWEIQNLTFFHSNSFPLAYKNSFRKLFLYAKGKELEWKNDKIWISQKWFEISTPNFHQLFTSIVGWVQDWGRSTILISYVIYAYTFILKLVWSKFNILRYHFLSFETPQLAGLRARARAMRLA